MASPLNSALVTGGTGFVGSHIIARLLDEHSTAANPIAISCLTRNPPSSKVKDPRVSYHTGDITNESQMKELFDKVKPQVVIHAAGLTTRRPAYILNKTNIEGTKVLLRVAKGCPSTRAFVFTSSCRAVVPTQEPLTEDKAVLYDEKNPTHAYGQSKAISDRLTLEANCEDLRTAVMRVPSMYGERDPNLMTYIIDSIKKNQRGMQVGDNKKIHELLYIGSAAEAHILAAKALLVNPGDPSLPKVDGEAFFIAEETPQRWFDFSRQSYALAGYPVKDEEIKTVPLWLVQTMASAAEWAYWIGTFGYKVPGMLRGDIDFLDEGSCWSIEKAKTRLGYRPLIGQDEALERSVKWAVENLM